jgi:hypothetical protein
VAEGRVSVSDERQRFLERRLEEEPGDQGAYAGLCADLERRGERPRVLAEVVTVLEEVWRKWAPRVVLAVPPGVDLARCFLTAQGWLMDVDDPGVRLLVEDGCTVSKFPLLGATASGLFELEIRRIPATSYKPREIVCLVVRGRLGVHELAINSWVELLDGDRVLASSVALCPRCQDGIACGRHGG